MGILKSCCIWGSIRTGCYICMVYTIILSIVTVALSGFELTFRAMERTFEFATSIINVSLGVLMFLASFGLGYGVYKDNRLFLLPWLLVMVLYTAHEIMNFTYYIYQLIMSEETNAVTTNPGVFWFTALTWPFELYCILCVTSQYQELLAGRGRIYTLKRLSAPSQPYVSMPRASTETTNTENTENSELSSSHKADSKFPSNDNQVLEETSSPEHMAYNLQRLETIQEDTVSLAEDK